MADTQKKRLGREAEPAGRMILNSQGLRGGAAIVVVVGLIRIAIFMTVPVVMVVNTMLVSMETGLADAVALSGEDAGAEPGEHAEQQHPYRNKPHR